MLPSNILRRQCRWFDIEDKVILSLNCMLSFLHTLGITFKAVAGVTYANAASVA